MFTILEQLNFTQASQLNAQALAKYILEKVSDLDLGNLISQCYDGASIDYERMQQWWSYSGLPKLLFSPKLGKTDKIIMLTEPYYIIL